MWNNLFFLYSVVVMIMSGVVNAKLANVSGAENIKYLNNIVLAMSVALSSLVVGLVIGQSSYVCAQRKNIKVHNGVSQAALLVLALVMEGLLIAMVSDPEFKNLTALNAESHSVIIAMLVLNSLGIIGGIMFVAYPQFREMFVSCSI